MPAALLDPPISSDDLYEVIDDQISEMPEMSAESMWVANEVATRLNSYGWNSIGRASVNVLIRLLLPKGRQRRPDVIFVPYTVWPKEKAAPRTNAWDITPAICVEVVSPTDLAEELMTKVTEYLDAGVGQVWVIYPMSRSAVVHHADKSCRLLRAEDSLTGGPALPGFAVSLAELIPEQPAE